MLGPRGWLALMAVIGPLCLSAQAQTLLQLNETAPAGGPESAALSAFKNEIESGTKGQIQVELHFDGALGNVSTSLEKLMAGEIDLFSGDLGSYLPLLIDEVSGLQLPFLLPNNSAARAYLASSLFDEGREKVIKFRRIRFLETDAFRGPVRMIASRRPFQSLAELSGLKIAVFPAPSKAGIDVWRALGVSVVDIDWKDVAAQLNQHVIDAVIAPTLTDLLSPDIVAAAPIVGQASDFPQVWQISVNEVTWQKLDPAQQSLVAKAAQDAAKIFNRQTEDRFKKSIPPRPGNRPLPTIDALTAHQMLLPTYARLIDEGATSQRVRDTANSAILPLANTK